MATDPNTSVPDAPQLSTSRKVLYAVLVPLLYLFLRLLYASYRIGVEGEEHLRNAVLDGQPVIPCYWHQMDLVLAIFLLTRNYPAFRAAFFANPDYRIHIVWITFRDVLSLHQLEIALGRALLVRRSTERVTPIT